MGGWLLIRQLFTYYLVLTHQISTSTMGYEIDTVTFSYRIYMIWCVVCSMALDILYIVNFEDLEQEYKFLMELYWFCISLQITAVRF